MSTRLEPAVWPPPRTGGEHATREWLDALASGRCDPDTFSRAMRDQFKSDRNGNWEVLSLLDQYFRRGKLKSEVFQTVKSRLEVSALGANETPAAVARARGPSLAPASEPVLAPAAREKPHTVPRGLAVGDVLRRRYRIVAEVGHGGTGTVFEAIDDYRLDLPTTDLRVAIKVLYTVEQQREFQHLQLLSHANIVRVHEFDRDGAIDFFTMEYLSGAPLGKLLTARNGSVLPRPYALTIIRDVGDALSYAHSRGVVHGDLNPQNVFITNDGELRVLGFGASHPLLEGRSPDVRDDVFDFSCVAYVLLAGRHPFPQHTALEARLRRLRPDRPAGLTGRQWSALRAGLHWERAKRPSDVGLWLESFGVHAAAARLPPLSAMLRTPPPRKRHPVLKTAAAALFVVLIAAGYWVMTEEVSPAHAEAGWDSRVKSALTGIGAALARLIPARSLKPAVTEPMPIATDVPNPPESAARAPALSTDGTAPGTAPGSPAAPIAPAAPTTRTSPAPRIAPTTSAISGAPATPPIRVARAVGSAVAPVAAAAAPHAATSQGAANVGPVRIEMAADTVDLPADEAVAHVIVRRKGSLHGDSRFTWWTESGTAKPGVDFTAVAPHSAEFTDGGNTLSLNVPVADTPHNQPKSFYVVIGPAETGATLGARTLTMVTILPPER